MIDRIGRMKRMMAAGMLAAVLLGGCGAGPVDLSASSAAFEEEEEEEAGQETEAQQLEKQLIAILNLNAEEKVEADASLKQAADFFLTYVLQDPQAYCEIEQPVDLDGLLDNKNTIALVYDGQLSAVQAGKEVLTALNTVDDPVLMYYRLKSIAVAFGEGEKGPVWLVLAQYGIPSSTAGMTGQEAGMSLGGTSQETEEIGGEEDDSARPA